MLIFFSDRFHVVRLMIHLISEKPAPKECCGFYLVFVLMLFRGFVQESHEGENLPPELNQIKEQIERERFLHIQVIRLSLLLRFFLRILIMLKSDER